MESLRWVFFALLFFFVAARLLGWEPTLNWQEFKATFARKWSTWLNSAGILNLLLVLPLDPTSSLSFWNMMPMHIQQMIPEQTLLGIGLSLWILAWIASYVRQHRVETARDLVTKTKEGDK